MDVPFALRGYLSGAGCEYQLNRATFSSCASSLAEGSSQPRIALSGFRALHSSRVVCEPSTTVNRPLSPHLPVKKPQLWATYSISHRILGGVVACAIMLPPIAMKFSLLCDV